MLKLAILENEYCTVYCSPYSYQYFFILPQVYLTSRNETRTTEHFFVAHIFCLVYITHENATSLLFILIMHLPMQEALQCSDFHIGMKEISKIMIKKVWKKKTCSVERAVTNSTNGITVRFKGLYYILF